MALTQEGSREASWMCTGCLEQCQAHTPLNHGFLLSLQETLGRGLVSGAGDAGMGPPRPLNVRQGGGGHIQDRDTGGTQAGGCYRT